MFGDAYTFHLTYLGNRPNSSLRPSDADSARLTIHGDRDKLLHSLLKSYILPPLLKMGLMKVVKPKAAGFNHLRKFHDETYLNCIRNGPKWLSNKMRQEYTQWEEEEEEVSKANQRGLQSDELKERSACTERRRLRSADNSVRQRRYSQPLNRF